MEDSFFQKLLKSPLAFIGGLILFFVILHHVWGMTGRLLSFYSEERRLETKIAELQKRNEDIKREIDYTDTEGFLEREGKARLNLRKPGEEVAVIVLEKEVVKSEDVNKSGFVRRMWVGIVSFFK